MRYLKPVNSDNKLIDVNKESVDAESINAINSRIDALSTLIQNNDDKFNQHIIDLKSNVDTNKLITIQAYTNELESDKISADTITTSTLNSDTIDSRQIQASTLIANDRVHAPLGEFTNIDANTISAADVGANNIAADDANIKSLTVSTLNITGNYDFDEITTDSIIASTINTSTIESNDLIASNANIDNISIDKATINEGIITHSRLQHICNEEIWHSYYNEEYQNSFESTIYEMPLFKQGNYVFTLRDKDTLQEIFSLYITNSESNLTYAYSKGRQYLTSDKDPLSEAKVKDVYSNPRLYVKSDYTGVGYWHYEGIDHIETVSPATYVSWPFDISLSNVMSYRAFHRAATVFTMHLDYGDNSNTGVSGGSLVIYLKDRIEELSNTESTYEYNPQSGDTVIDFYVPNQTLNTDSNVSFNRVSVNELAITSITENFMFLRSRDDGTFEVVLALNPESINGIQPIDNPITGNAVYYWNGIALGGSVSVNDVITVDTSLNLCSNTGNNTYTLQQWTLKSGVPTTKSKAFKAATENKYLFFDTYTESTFYDRPVVRIEITSPGKYQGLYYSWFTDDGSPYESNAIDYDMDEWSVPTYYYHAFLHDATYYSTAERVPITTDEGTNEYHLIHLGDGTTTHGSHTIESNLTVIGSTYVSGPITGNNSINGKDAHFTTAEIKDASGEVLVASGIINAQREVNAPLITASLFIGSDIETSNLIASNIYADTIHTNKFEASTLTADKISTPYLVASQIDANNIVTSTFVSNDLSVFKGNVDIEGSNLIASTTDSFFNSVDSAIVKANQLRERLSHINIDNEDNESEVGIIANINASTIIHLDIGENDIRYGKAGEQIALAERDEKSNLNANVPTIWDGNKLTTVSIPFDTNDSKLKHALIAERDSIDSTEWNVKWGSAGSDGANKTLIFSTIAQLEERLAITNMADPDYIPSDSLCIVTEDADSDYIYGEEHV